MSTQSNITLTKREFLACSDQRLLVAVHHHQLMRAVGGNAASEEAAVVGFIIEDVREPWRWVLAMRIACIEEGSVGVDPEDKVGVTVRELFDRCATTACAWREKGKARGRFVAAD